MNEDGLGTSRLRDNRQVQVQITTQVNDHHACSFCLLDTVHNGAHLSASLSLVGTTTRLHGFLSTFAGIELLQSLLMRRRQGYQILEPSLRLQSDRALPRQCVNRRKHLVPAAGRKFGSDGFQRTGPPLCQLVRDKRPDLMLLGHTIPHVLLHNCAPPVPF